MTSIGLCAGPHKLLVEWDGRLYVRRSGRPNEALPYEPSYLPTFLHLARTKHGMTGVLGLHGEDKPEGADDGGNPDLRLKQLEGGRTVFRVIPR